MARPLPHNKEAEAAVLAGVMLRNEALNDVITIIDEDSFYVPAYKAVFRAMVKLADRGQPIDPVTLEHQLRATDELGLVGGLEGLGKLADRYASSHHVASHAELVRQTSSIRKLVQTAQDIAEEGREGVEDVNDFIDNAERRLLEVNQSGRTGGYRSAKDLIHGVFESITERAKLKNPITGVPTGFVKLDEMTGGMQPGDLIILAAYLILVVMSALGLHPFVAVLIAAPVMFASLPSRPRMPTPACTELRMSLSDASA